MRSLPNIIKSSEYVTIKNGRAFPANNKALHSAKQDNAQDEHKIIVDKALLEAQQLMEAAQNYSLNKVKETTQQMNDEAAQVWAQSHENGYQEGLNDGRKDGSELGYKEGYAKGMEKAEEENKATLDELTVMLETVEAMKSEILQKFEDDIERLAVAIAEKVIKKEISIDTQVMQTIIQSALDSYTNQSWVKILVSKNMKTMLINSDHSIIQALREVSENIRIETSPDMGDDECKIDLPDRMIDVGADTQITKIKQALSL